MLECVQMLPFGKLTNYKYLTLEVMKFIDYFDALKFMFKCNLQSRLFLESKIDTMQNEFENEGLITFELRLDEF